MVILRLFFERYCKLLLIKLKAKKEEPAAPVEFQYDVITEVADQSTFDSICAASKICIIAFLDPTNSESQDQSVFRNHDYH